MPYKGTFDAATCAPSGGHVVWYAAPCCAGWMPGTYPANSMRWDNAHHNCFYSHDAAGYVGCPNGTNWNLTNLLTPLDFTALDGYGPSQPFRCNNANLLPGYFTPGLDPAYYGCNTSGLLYGAYGNSVYSFQPGLAGLNDNIGGNCAHSLDDSCKNLYGSVAICYDVHGNVVNCATFNPGADNFYWRVNPPAWDNASGACISSVDVLSTGHTPTAGHNRSPFYQGCPTGLASVALTPQDFGLLTDAASQNPTYILPASDHGPFGVASPFSVPRGRMGGPGSGFYYFASYAIDVVSGNPTGLSTTTGTAPCYAPFSGQFCPTNGVDDGLSPKGCPGVVVGPSCTSPATYQAAKTGAPGVGPWCITEHLTLFPNLQLDAARNKYGQLFTVGGGGVSARNDAIKELNQQLSSLGIGAFASIHCRDDGTLDVFWANYAVVSTVPNEWFSYLYSDDSGRTWKPTPVGYNEWDSGVHPPGDVMGIVLNPAIPGKVPQGAGEWVAPIRIYHKTAGDAAQIYGCHVLMSKSHHGLAVAMINRGGQWWCYRLKQDAPPAWTWQLSDPVFVSNGEMQSGWFQQHHSGDYEFFFYDDTGKLRWARCEDIAFDRVGSWNWYAEGAAHNEWDGQALERYTAITYHDDRDGLLMEIIWVPDLLGDVYSADWIVNPNGNYYVLPHVWNPITKVFDATASPVSMGIHKPFGGGQLRREKGGQWVARLMATGAGVYRCNDLTSLGTGTWVQD